MHGPDVIESYRLLCHTAIIAAPSTHERYNADVKLKVGDRVRIVRLPPAWDDPKYIVPRQTRAVFRRLIERRRPLRVYEVDHRGEAWVRCRFRNARGRIEYHSVTLDEGCWVRATSYSC